jgi:hypothetical protein
LNSALAQDWHPTSVPNKGWQSVVMSEDGDKLAGFSFHTVYVSTNSGFNWASNSLPYPYFIYCLSAASSGDGSVLVAGSQSGGLCTSTNGGQNWATNDIPFGNWQPVTVSADGNKLTAFSWYNNLSYTSTNSGMTWMSNSPPTTNSFPWVAMTCSTDGSKLTLVGWQDLGMALPNHLGLIVRSTNSGATWQTVNAPNTNWCSIAGSADGSILVAAANDPKYDYSPSVAFISTNSGLSWKSLMISARLYGAASVACSKYGDCLMIADSTYPGYIYTSTNTGTTWITNNAPSAYWKSVASSADGSKLAAADYNGLIYTWQSSTALGVNPLDNNLLFSWPILSSSKFLALEQNSDLTGTNWVPVPTAPTMVNGRYQVIISTPASNSFYRLRSQ